MLPSYPPAPRHVSGFDMMLSYAGVEDGDHARAETVVRALRRVSLRRGATLSAAKSLESLMCFLPARSKLAAARKLTLEAPEPWTFFWLASHERRAGHTKEEALAARRMLRLAERVGDLDGAQVARRVLRGVHQVQPDSFSQRLLAGGDLKTQTSTEAYERIRMVKRQALRLGGRATALACARRLLLVAAHVRDDSAGLRFARERLAMEVSSFSVLAMALAHERCGDERRARVRFAEALRLAIDEGDLHRATKATAGLLRTRGEALVTKSELRWVMAEAVKEPDGPPDHLFLGATLGWFGVHGG